VAEAEKGRRLQTIIALQEAQSATINRTLIGSTTEVLIEGPARRRDGWYAGKSPQFKTVVFPADGIRMAELVPVRITDSTAHTLVGEVEESKSRKVEKSNESKRPHSSTR
jgi:tRNA A37 methylthiotransferase MiaB